MHMVLYICQDGDRPSGVATYGYSMLRHLPDARMLLLNAARPPLTAPADLRHLITTVPRESSHDPALVARAIAALAAEHSGGLTLLPNTGDTPWAAAASWLRDASPAARAQCRILGIVHSDMETQYSIADHYAAVAPLWIGVSRRCATELRRRLSSRSAEVHELPYPVEMWPTLPARDNGGALRLAYVGRLEEPQKRISRLVPLFGALGERGIDFHATIAGDGPAAADLADALAAAAPPVRARVHLLGSVAPDRVGAIWRTHDICILVSDFEGLPLALLEAMAAGVCPVVMRVESGVAEILADRHNARVVRRGDVNAMAEAIAELHADRDQLRRLQRAAWNTAATYAPEPHFAELHRLLARCWSCAPPDAAAVAADDTATAVAGIVARVRTAKRPVVVYGSGMFGRKIIDRCLDEGLVVAGLIDSDPAQAGQTYRNLVCRAPEQLDTFGDVSFAVGSLHFAEEIADRLVHELGAARARDAIVAAGRS